MATYFETMMLMSKPPKRSNSEPNYWVQDMDRNMTTTTTV